MSAVIGCKVYYFGGCTGGWPCEDLSIQSNELFAYNVSDCVCPSGFTSDGAGACEACAAGKYKAGSGNEACTDCGAGKYSAASGAAAESTCSACTANSDAPAGSDAASDCICIAGFTSDGAGGDGVACAACIAGTYKDVNGSAPCSLCSQGKYSTAIAEISESTCIDCPAHTYSGIGSKQQTNCTCNKGYTGPDGAACAACIAGTYRT